MKEVKKIDEYSVTGEREGNEPLTAVFELSIVVKTNNSDRRAPHLFVGEG
jgi:hypothetical protein